MTWLVMGQSVPHQNWARMSCSPTDSPCEEHQALIGWPNPCSEFEVFPFFYRNGQSSLVKSQNSHTHTWSEGLAMRTQFDLNVEAEIVGSIWTLTSVTCVLRANMQRSLWIWFEIWIAHAHTIHQSALTPSAFRNRTQSQHFGIHDSTNWQLFAGNSIPSISMALRMICTSCDRMPSSSRFSNKSAFKWTSVQIISQDHWTHGIRMQTSKK